MSVPGKSLLAVAAVALLGGIGWWWWQAHRPAAAAGSPPPVPVGVAVVERRDVPALIRAVGNVRSHRSVEIRSRVDGQLVALRVHEGQAVRRGELMARIDDRAIAAALAQAQAQLAVARAQLASARLDLGRYRTLAKTQTIPAQTLDQQTALVAQLEATVRTQEANVAANRVQLSYTRIVAPSDGRVGLRNVDEGSFVRASDTQGLFSVVQLDPISVEVALPQAQLPQLQTLLVHAGDAPVPVRAYTADGGTLLAEGRLGSLDNRVSADTGTIRFKAEFANPNGRLWPDQSVVVTLQSGVLGGALVVPQKAVQQGAESALVWRIRDGKADARPVQVAYADERIAVVTGVEAGDQVVVDGHSRLRPGAAVRILPAAPAATPAAAATPPAANRSAS
ncbi:efflux RND transporter periplasmic adaptor subunit [Frateuria defendens]|uniref:efflux RND transporter periplasmic adaptor subunit n=1 Tax=Frateuria defendens TaxID=2219559 RepID=UPI00066FFA38|nr:efflux RND transporter periplasmic adaptor subunit [Frateuria defendens]